MSELKMGTLSFHLINAYNLIFQQTAENGKSTQSDIRRLLTVSAINKLTFLTVLKDSLNIPVPVKTLKQIAVNVKRFSNLKRGQQTDEQLMLEAKKLVGQANRDVSNAIDETVYKHVSKTCFTGDLSELTNLQVIQEMIMRSSNIAALADYRLEIRIEDIEDWACTIKLIDNMIEKECAAAKSDLTQNDRIYDICCAFIALHPLVKTDVSGGPVSFITAILDFNPDTEVKLRKRKNKLQVSVWVDEIARQITSEIDTEKGPATTVEARLREHLTFRSPKDVIDAVDNDKKKASK